jgi:hypothetical protein
MIRMSDAPPAIAQRGTPVARLGAVAGVAGPLLLAAYFGAPALAGWPFSGASPDALMAYARAHVLLFYVGGWLQATGALLSGVFFLVLVQMSGARDRLEGLIVAVGVAVLLSLVLVEGALLEAVPIGTMPRSDSLRTIPAFACRLYRALLPTRSTSRTGAGGSPLLTDRPSLHAISLTPERFRDAPKSRARTAVFAQ